MLSLTTFILIGAAVFMGGLIDSMAGGGGLITLPAYMIAGLPPHLALGTNKFVNATGTFVAVLNYVRNRKISLFIVLAGIPFSLAGSFLGTRAIQLFSDSQAGKIILFLMPLGLVATFLSGRDHGEENRVTLIGYLLIIPLVCFVIGFYDGFFGPGTGMFLTLSLHLFLKLDLLHATANAKVFNLLSNVGALIAFITRGQVLPLQFVLPLMGCSILGNVLGSHLALTRGKKAIKAGLFVSLALLLGTLVYRMF